MSAKWRAIQHRHRYTYSSVVFPPYFIDALNQTPSLPFFSQLKHLSSLNSTYSQVEHAKNVVSAFTDLLSNPNADAATSVLASKFYLEILFFENSLPLHRTLASGLAKAKHFHGLLKDCFRQLCEEYGGGDGNGKGKRFSVSRAALSMMSTPKLGYLVEVVEECAVLVGLDVVSGLDAVVSETNDWSRPSPLVMEQCQEALSCIYYLLQRFPTKFSNGGERQDGFLAMVFVTVLSILKSLAFSRDCFVAAGVSFCAALQVCLSPEELGLFIMEGIFMQTSVISCKIKFQDVNSKIPYKGDTVNEISKFTALSRLCLIRGILTAVSRTVLSSNFVVSTCDFENDSASGDSTLIKTILYDSILPELCYYCENPTDSHFNFHALTVMQICFQQIKTSMQSNIGDFAESYNPLSEQMGRRILRTVWNNLEDPLSQTVKQVHLIFDLFLDIQASLLWAEGGEKIKLFLREIASDLLCLGPRCKGRYVPLASLTKRLGAKTILAMSPDLLFETTKAYVDDDVCCAATTFLKCFLECLRKECWTSDGIENGYAKYRGDCLPPFLYGLASGVAKLRSNVNTYALPIVLELDVDGLFPMLASIGVKLVEDDTEIVYPELHYTEMSLGLEQRVAILVSLLRVSRSIALIEGDIDYVSESFEVAENSRKYDMHSFVCVRGIKVKIPVKWLVLALSHTDESLRTDAAEFLFLNPKTASLPSSLELSLLKEAVPLNMRCCSTAFQMKWTSMFRKFFSRVRTALERQYKQGNWYPYGSEANVGVASRNGTREIVVEMADDLFNLMKWLSYFFFFSCYPSAPYERKIMAMELILVMLNVWSVMPPSKENHCALSSDTSLYPYSKGFILADSALLLVGSIIDSWDRLRENSFRILLHFPTPLPGICSPDEIREAIIWAKKLVCSPRVRECDAGALTLRLIFRKYVLELNWSVQLSLDFVSCHGQVELPNGKLEILTHRSPAVEYVRSLVDWLLITVEDGEKDLSEACKKSFVHGVLLTLRYTFEELDWNSTAVLCCIAEMKLVLEKLLELIMRITSLALWVVSADAWHLPEDMEDMVDDDGFDKEVMSKVAVENVMENVKLVQDARSSEQIVMVGCWLAMKEVSLLLGTIIRKIPLPIVGASKSNASDGNGDSVSVSDGVLDMKQLETIGSHFLEVLLKMKHNGAIDKTRAGFTALCNRLLCSNNPRLCKLTESWMEQLMERTVTKGQTVDDLLRRSAGIPAAFTAIFLAEPEGSPKRLLPRALRWLLDVANKSLLEQTKASNCTNDSADALLTNSSQAGQFVMPLGMDAKEKISKIRDEGVVPTVHVFNVLRAAFNDSNLATDTSGFSAEALIYSIRSFSSPYWEVRNSACLAYSALIRRMIGFLNVQKRESARRALTGLEFFHRYPTLHSFLFHELKIATESLLDGSSGQQGSNLAKLVHPSLCPILILLSRLKPSAVTSEAGDSLDPFIFLPFIRKCSVQSNFRIRILASRALTGLISNEKLPIVLLNIASELPCTRNVSSDASNSIDTQNGTCHTFNSLHGMLLQLNTLLDNNCRCLADSSKKDAILKDLIEILAIRSWIGKFQLCPCPILNSCFLGVLDNMLSIATTCQMSKSIAAIWNLVWELSSEFLDLEEPQKSSYHDPTIVELRKQAAVSYFNCLYKTSKEIAEEDILMPGTCSSTTASSLLRVSDLDSALSRFQERLRGCMSDTSYEVRLATFKWLVLFVKSAGLKIEGGNSSSHEIKTYLLYNIDLQKKLVELLATENNHKCTYYILKIIYMWNMLECEEKGELDVSLGSIGVDRSSLWWFWDKLVSMYKVTRHSKNRQVLICCMGICVKQFASIFSSFVCSNMKKEEIAISSRYDIDGRLSKFCDCINYFVELIQLHSSASEPVNMRNAAAESIAASGLLDHAKIAGSLPFSNSIPGENPSSDFKVEEVVNMYGHKILNLWLTCIRLLEDEDVELRRKLALDVQKSVTSTTCQNVELVPSQVEKVIEMSFDHLSSIFGHWIDYFDSLCNYVFNAVNSVVSVVPNGDLVRRVFDKEIDNHHEEKLLICQICCSHLEKLPISKSWAANSSDNHKVRDLLRGWRRRFCHHLTSFANDYIGRREVDWIGGAGNHKDAFLPLYGNLLAFFALSNCIFEGEKESSKSMLDEVSVLGRTLRPFLRNPMISNLYLLVIDSHEKMVGATASDMNKSLIGNSSDWEGFNPYFLLRCEV
ncbi:unnamed protein product [Coffea canephora]|uniref:Uncharacterized protein n=1 Tax=Coffea canephora TaxID=49390 RepID=A0A068U253_COFCA|nr:unnamed protein product [Coffea canephora]